MPLSPRDALQQILAQVLIIGHRDYDLIKSVTTLAPRSRFSEV